MSNPRFYIGQLDQATFTMTEAESPGYPLSNLKNYLADHEWHSPTPAANQRLIMDWGSAKECDFAIIENHNFAALGATAVKLEAADDAGFTTGLVTLSSTLASLGSPGKIEFTAETKRYWSILFEKTSGTLNAIPRLGQLFINKKFEVTTGYNFGYRAGNKEFETHIKQSLGGIELAHQNHDGRTIFEFRLSLQDDVFKTNWIALCNGARGRLNPFYFVDPNNSSWYVKLAADYNPVTTEKANIHRLDQVMLRALIPSAGDTSGYGKRYGKRYGKHY